MTSFSEFCTRLQDRLGLDSSYVQGGDIPSSVKRLMKKFLRDYHFPKSLQLQQWTSIVADTQTYTLPAGTKKPHAVYFYDNSDPIKYGQPLTKREHRVLPHPDGQARHYWIIGSTLYTDIIIDATTAAEGINLAMLYESLDVDANESWMLEDFEDILFSYCMYRLSGEFGKPELMQIFAPIWQEDRTGLAIYSNELEFDDLYIVQRELNSKRLARYPAELIS